LAGIIGKIASLSIAANAVGITKTGMIFGYISGAAGYRSTIIIIRDIRCAVLITGTAAVGITNAGMVSSILPGAAAYCFASIITAVLSIATAAIGITKTGMTFGYLSGAAAVGIAIIRIRSI
jgi:hypothetical protein